MNATIKDRAVLITGCSSGIGRCAAITLHERGYRVFATTRKPEDTEALTNSGISALHLDLTDYHSIEKTLAIVLNETGGNLYGLFNNGGFGQTGAVEDLPTEALRAQFETLVFGWHELTRQIIPVMRAQGHGRIIQNSSVLGFAAMPYRGAYNCLLYTSPSPRDRTRSRMPSSA